MIRLYVDEERRRAYSFDTEDEAPKAFRLLCDHFSGKCVVWSMIFRGGFIKSHPLRDKWCAVASVRVGKCPWRNHPKHGRYCAEASLLMVLSKTAPQIAELIVDETLREVA